MIDRFVSMSDKDIIYDKEETLINQTTKIVIEVRMIVLDCLFRTYIEQFSLNKI